VSYDHISTTASKDKQERLSPVGLLTMLTPSLMPELASLGRFEALPVGARTGRQGLPHTSLSLILESKLVVNCSVNSESV
jgi:hypothetical protein